MLSYDMSTKTPSAPRPPAREGENIITFTYLIIQHPVRAEREASRPVGRLCYCMQQHGVPIHGYERGAVVFDWKQRRERALRLRPASPAPARVN